jgi:hypothetical protein
MIMSSPRRPGNNLSLPPFSPLPAFLEPAVQPAVRHDIHIAAVPTITPVGPVESEGHREF